MSTSEKPESDAESPESKPADKPATPPASEAPRAQPVGLGWLWATLGALVLAGGVGVAVYFYMSWQHGRSVDAQVQRAVAEASAAAKQGPQGPPPATVRVAQVSEQSAKQRVMVVGRLLEVKRSTVASEVEGKVVELLTPAGREVVGGETVIARVDPVWSRLAVEQAQADLAAAKATARQSANELKNLEALAQRSAADPQAIDDARAVAEADAARVIAVEAALHRAEETGKRVDIIAPFDGTVSAKLTEKGQWLAPGSPVVEVVSRGLIDAVIDVPEQYITQVPKGTPIEIVIDALGQTIVGEVIAINPDGSNPARTFPVKVRLDDQGGKLKIGMSVTARVPVSAEKTYLVVPRDAVQYGDGGAQVWVAMVTPNSAPGSMPQAMPMPVEVLFGLDGKFAIKPLPKMPGARLDPGMDIVVEGAERLFPTRPLVVMPPGVPMPEEQPPPGRAGPPDAEQATRG
ncbi:MAG: efflux RND transporter periplasmic adaptor subunit [Phycisphaeraceae bacterium]